MYCIITVIQQYINEREITMIFDKIENRNTYSYEPKLAKVLAYMEGMTAENFPAEGVKLDGDQAFVNPVCFTSKPEEECIFEAHRKYADVHFVVEGCEKVIVRDINAVKVHTPYSEEKDIGFYTCDEGIAVVIHPGEFLVCYPQDAHKVAIAPDGPAPIKKLVGKVRVTD